MISEERIRKVFTELAAIDSESFGEKEIGENVTGRLSRKIKKVSVLRAVMWMIAVMVVSSRRTAMATSLPKAVTFVANVRRIDFRITS